MAPTAADVRPALREEACRLGLAPVERPRAELDRLAGGGVHQGVVALCGEYAYATLAEILDRAQASGQPPLSSGRNASSPGTERTSL